MIIYNDIAMLFAEHFLCKADGTFAVDSVNGGLSQCIYGVGYSPERQKWESFVELFAMCADRLYGFQLVSTADVSDTFDFLPTPPTPTFKARRVLAQLSRAAKKAARR